ncbi:MAG: transposase [Sphingomonadaceae bacterium]
MSDYKGAALMIDAFPKAKALLADRGYDADWFRAALEQRGIIPCIPPKTNRKVQYRYDMATYKKRHLVESLSPKSRAGGAPTHAIIALCMPSCQQSASPKPSYFGAIVSPDASPLPDAFIQNPGH